MNITIEQLIARLQRIAEANDDAFIYKMTFGPCRKGIVHIFYCEERADHHPFVSGRGFSVDEALLSAWSNIEPICSSWGYDPVS